MAGLGSDVTIAIIGQDGLSGPVRAAESALSGLGSTAQRAGGLISSAFSAIGTGVGLAAGIAGFQGMAASMRSVADAAVGLNSRLEQSKIGFTSMLGSAEAATGFLKELQQFAVATPFEFPQLVTASQRMLAFGFNVKEVIPLLTAVGSTAAAMGVGAEGIDRITNALGQMRAATTVQLGELNQLTEVGVPSFEILATAMGKTTGEIKKMVSNGEIASDVFIKAFQEWSNTHFGDMMEKQSHTFQGAMSTIHDSLTMAIANGFQPFFAVMTRVADRFAQFLQTDQFTRWVTGVTAASQRGADALTRWGTSITALGRQVLGATGQIKGFADTLRQQIEPGLRAIGDTITRAVMGPIVTLRTQFLGLEEDASALDTAKGLVLGLVDAAGRLVGIDLDDYARGWDTLGATIQRALEIIGPPLREISTVMLGNFQANVNALTTTYLPALGRIVEQTWGFIRDTALPFTTALGNTMRTILGDTLVWLAGGPLKDFYKILGDTATFIEQKILPRLPDLANVLRTTLGGALSWLATDGWPTFLKAAGTAIDALGPILEGAAKWFNEMLIPAAQEFGAWIGPKLEEAVTAGKSVLAALGTVVQQTYEWFVQLTGEISKTSIYDDLSAAWRALSDIGAEFVRDVLGPSKTGLDDNATSAEKFAAGLSDITSKIEPMIRWAQHLAEILNDLQRGFTNAGLALRWYLQIMGVPLPNNPFPNIFPSAPGSQGTYPGLPSSPPTSQAPQVPSIITPAPKAPEVTAPPAPPSAVAPSTGAPAAGGMKYGEIDNSSRAAFVRTAWPYMLEAAGGNQRTAQLMLGAAISENGDVGQGGGFIGNNFFGIKGQGPAGSFTARTWESVNGQRVPTDAQFAAYNSPVEGFGGFFDFLQRNPRYAPALAAYQQTGDADQLFNDVRAAGYATDPDWSDKIRNITRNQVTPNIPQQSPISSLPTLPTASTGPNAAGISDFRQSQREWAQNAADAGAICGPYLASLFADAVGRPPTPEEARALAEKMGIYNRANGGSGILNASQFDEYATALIQQANPGSSAYVTQTGVGSAAEASGIAQQSLAGGAPIVGFNTPNHYFGATGYDPSTGQFNVGGTGRSIGGSEFMTIDQITALGGGITSVIQLMGQLQPAAEQASMSLQEVGTAAAVGTPQLAEIGATIDPVVASFTEGTTSVTGLTDAIIASAAGQGVATESAFNYATGLTTQDQALRAVLESFAATTPAAAELLTQLDAGSISTDQAAVAFAGLATTTATATGAVGEMATAVGEDVTAMSTTTVEQTDLMKVGVGQATTDMSVQAQADAVAMAAWVAGEAQQMQSDTVAAASAMNSETVAEMAALHSSAVEEASGTRSDAVEQFKQMGDDIVEAAKSAASDTTEAFADIKIEAPDVSNVIKAMDKVKGAAKEAASAVGKISGGNKGDGKNPLAKAGGGSVFRDETYLVGERGPELFTPSLSGYIIPNNQLSGSGNDDRIVRLLERIEAKLNGGEQNFNLTVNSNAPTEPIIQDFATLKALARSAY